MRRTIAPVSIDGEGNGTPPIDGMGIPIGALAGGVARFSSAGSVPFDPSAAAEPSSPAVPSDAVAPFDSVASVSYVLTISVSLLSAIACIPQYPVSRFIFCIFSSK